MSLKSSVISFRGRFEKIFTKKVLGLLGALVVFTAAGAGVAALVMATAANDRVSVSYGKRIYYGWAYWTNQFTVSGSTVSGGSVRAMCANPTQTTAYGDATVVDPATMFSSSQITQMKRVLLVTDNTYDSSVYNKFLDDHDDYGNYWDNLARYDDYLPSTGDSTIKSYVIGHIIMGELFGDGWVEIDDEDAAEYAGALDEINNWFDSGNGKTVKVSDYNMFIGVMDTSGQQRVVWLEAPETKYAKIRAKKVDSFDGTALKGAKFTLYERGSSDSIDDAAQIIKTGWASRTNGYTTWVEDIPLDGKRYCIYETAAPAGYFIDGDNPQCSKKFTEANYGTTLVWEATFSDSEELEPLPYGGVRIQKKDAETANTPQGNATLAGAEFTVYSDGLEVAKVVIEYNESAGTYVGENDFDLQVGSYIVKETKAPKGYNRNTEWEGTCDIVNDGDICKFTGSNSVTDTVIKGGIEIEKKNSVTGEPMPNVKFEIYKNYGDKALVKTVQTGSDGKYTMPEAEYLPYGSYKLHEVADEANAGYTLIGDKTFTIKANGIAATNKWTGDNALKDAPEDTQFSTKLRNAESAATAPTTTVGIGENVSLIDRVTFTEGHKPVDGRVYRITATVYGQKAGSTTWEQIGEPKVDAALRGAKLASDGYHEVTLNVDTRAYAGGKLTVVTVMHAMKDGQYTEEIFKHNEDKSSTDETVTIENTEYGLSSNACKTGTSDCGKTVGVGKVSVTDNVRMSGLIPGKKYIVTGEAYCYTGDGSDKRQMDLYVASSASGEETLINAATLKSAEITASEATADTTIEFKFNSGDCGGGKKVGIKNVLYESNNGEPTGGALYTHNANMTITEQAVTVAAPTIGTTATSNSGTKEVELGQSVTIKDTIQYGGLVVGSQYCFVGKLMNGTELVKKVSGDAFTASAESGSVNMDFTGINSLTLAGKTLTVNEYLYLGACETGTLIASHENGAGQTVTVVDPDPYIGTTASVVGADSNVVEPTGKIRIKDVVAFHNFRVNTDYTFVGVLMIGENEQLMVPVGTSGERSSVNGITTIKTGTTQTDGTVTMEFPEISVEDLAGKRIVVYEVAYTGKYETIEAYIEALTSGALTEADEVAKHEDFSDGGQTVEVKAKVGTKVAESKTGKAVAGIGNAVIVDTIEYEGLVMGKTYTARGWLVDANGTKIEGSDGTTTFTIGQEPTLETSGKVNVSLPLRTVGLAGKKVVAFEEVYLSNSKIAEHKDLNDTKQTLTVETPTLKTNARDGVDGDREVAPSGEVKIVDTVTYSGLVIGNKYCIRGTLMDKETGRAVTVTKGEQVSNITAEDCFTADRTAGMRELTFVFDASQLGGKTFVVFEALFLVETQGEVKIIEHNDLGDAAQTVVVKPNTPETGLATVTRENSGAAAVVVRGGGIGFVIGLIGCGAYMYKNKRKSIGFAPVEV